ncbi:MAG: LicD family protein, partial [Sarcina sp.]
ESKYIFPLKEIDFEGIKVKCPNDNHIVLKKMYGDNYMEIPKVEDRYYHNLGLEIQRKRS